VTASVTCRPEWATGHGMERYVTGRAVIRCLRDRVLGGVLASVAALGIWLVAIPAGTATRLTVYWGVQPLLDLLMIFTCRRVVAMAGGTPPLARFWRWLARAGVLFCFGDLAQTEATWTHPDLDQLSGGALHAIFVGSGIAMMIVVTLTHPLELSGAQRRRTLLDVATVMAGAAAFVWYLDAGKTTVEAPILATVALLLVFGLVRLALSARPPFTRGATLVGVVGVAWTGVASALVPAHQRSTYLGCVLFLSLLPSVAIAVTPRVQELQMRANPAVLARSRRPYSLLPYVAVAACQVLLVFGAAQSSWSIKASGVLVGNVVVTVLVVVRQLDAFRENASLLTRLDSSLAALRRTEQRFRSLVQHSSDVTLIITAEGAISYASPALETVLGVTPHAAEGQQVLDLLEPSDHRAAREAWRRIAAGGTDTDLRLRARHSDGSVHWLEVTLTHLPTEPGLGGIVCNARDVTEAHQLQQRLQYQARHDALTRLANRAGFDEEAQRARGASTPTAVLMIDLNEFKPINDTHGHHVGDELLVQVAHRLRGCVRAEDMVARLGGDEFAVLLQNATPDQATSVADRITSSLSEPAAIEGKKLQISASVGVAYGLGRDLDILLKHADAAMYQVKRRRAGSGYACAPTST
jgi:diguanylate cyclase (GGDEF)-like protein/PAS domain S-box-containing protein